MTTFRLRRTAWSLGFKKRLRIMFDRKAHWQNIYQDKSALDVSWYQKEPVLSLELIRSTQVASGESIIDVGGCVSASGLPMQRRLYEFSGFRYF